MGIDVGVMKPIETGCRKRNGRLTLSDAPYLKTASKITDPIEMITPTPFSPLAPEPHPFLKKEIDLDEILFAYDQLCRRHSFVIVEGVGGLMVPLTARADVSDLIRLFELPVLLVARSGLGTINHTLLTLHHGADLGIQFLGIIFNRTSPTASLADKTNPATLAERTDIPLLGTLPYFKKTGNREKDIQRSEKLLVKDKFLRSSILHWINDD